MSDPRQNDPRLTDAPLHDDAPLTPAPELESSNNAMWGWIAGGVVLALLLVFVFGRSPTTSDTAIAPASPPAVTTGSAPASSPAAPRPSTTLAPSPSAPSGAQ